MDVILNISHLIITIFICLFTAYLLTTVDYVNHCDGATSSGILYACYYWNWHLNLQFSRDNDSLIRHQLKSTVNAHIKHGTVGKVAEFQTNFCHMEFRVQ